MREATGRYNEQSTELGARFKRTFYACVDALLNFPEKDAVRCDPVIRARLMRPFPYLVFYAVEDDVVYVLTVQYAGRKPALLRAIVRERRIY
ncbi:MAG: hypothetical protein RLZZ15_1789 [Verrucomicrobiota bacterium]